jgi:hypothetical protein
MPRLIVAVSMVLPDSVVGYFSDIEPHFDMFPRMFDTRVEINTTSKSDGDVVTLLSGLGIPFMSREEAGKEGGGRRKKQDEDAGDPWAKYKKRGAKKVVSGGGGQKKKK